MLFATLKYDSDILVDVVVSKIQYQIYCENIGRKCAQQRLETADILRNVRGEQLQALATKLPEERLRSFCANGELLPAKGSGSKERKAATAAG